MGESNGSWTPKKISSSGIVYNGPAVLRGFLIGTDGVNDVTLLSIYNGTDNTGNEVIPTHGINADALGLNGAMDIHADCPDGIYAEYTTSGTAELVVYYEPK